MILSFFASIAGGYCFVDDVELSLVSHAIEIDVDGADVLADKKHEWKEKKQGSVDSKQEAALAPDHPVDPTSILRRLLGEIIDKQVPHGSQVSRSAACTWLLCAVKYCGNHSFLQTQLPRIQHAFSALLTESNQFTQVRLLQ
jgi:hypothetical protein